ncbi:glycosyltransferase family 4 protein [Methylobacterium sp. NEAU 140]|uniref:glycosyltransferase family 4 protein n=1 Tax=Methylobacterium sp. NEAU 140 TaxID=3064945 RepID=UPI002732A4B1|nr:glycosyltransferase family 4 protein [Methylobacterium sp. NEAU 140]MDP4023749.1 glycosyltransferase family 4 protein [Methylobacterium sp. NEAU 140]
MKIAYLMNTYPLPSTTFIRREIEAIEARGHGIRRFAVRAWPQTLVDPRDTSERRLTHYILSGNLRGLLLAPVREIAVNPRGLLRALKPWFTLSRKARDGFVRPVAYLLEAIYFRQRAAAEQIDHVHVHFATNAATVAMLARLMGGPRYSFTVHGPDEFVRPERLGFDEKIAHAQFAVAISQYCRARLSSLGRPEDDRKIKVARCGLALEDFAAVRARSPDTATLVCVGRLCSAKGQVLIPAAVAGLRDRFPDLKVVLVGDGENREEIAAACRLHGVADRVVFHGWASNAQVRDLIASSRALLLPSFAEGLPIVIMEAFALARPVISTRVAGIPELLDDTCGWLIQPGDAADLARAIEEVLLATPAQLEAKGAVGRARVMRLHDRRTLARTLCQLFGATAANPVEARGHAS